MKVFEAVQKGISLVVEQRKQVGIIYVVNVCLAAVLGIPLAILMHGHVGKLVIRDELAQGFDYSWWSAFNFQAHGLEETIRPSLASGFGPLFDNLELLLTGKFGSFGSFIFFIALAYLFVAAFFNGGFIASISAERHPSSVARFFSLSGQFFHHMAALAVTAVLFFWLFYKVLQPALFSIVDSITAQSLSQPFMWISNFVGYAIIFFLVFLLTLLFDYAKVIVIVEKKQSSWLCIWLAAKFIFKHFGKTVGVNFVMVGISALVLVVGGALLSLAQASQVLMLVVALLLQQLYILIKIGLRLSFYGAETALYQGQTAAVRPIKKRKR